MVKAVFCDFYGTLVHENGPNSYEVIKRVFESGTAKSADEVVMFWNRSFHRLMNEFSGPDWRPQYELAVESFEETIARFEADEDARELCDLMVEHWCAPPLFDDAIPFLESIDSPVYLVTNSDDAYVTAAAAAHGIECAGIFTSEQARYAKPSSEIFRYALDRTGLKSYEVMHVGDSVDNDYRCPLSLGIEPIWLNRDGLPSKQPLRMATNLAEAAKILSRM